MTSSPRRNVLEVCYGNLVVGGPENCYAFAALHYQKSAFWKSLNDVSRLICQGPQLCQSSQAEPGMTRFPPAHRLPTAAPRLAQQGCRASTYQSTNQQVYRSSPWQYQLILE